ncbi:MAG: amidase [Bacteroidota bacterium]
MKPSAEKNGRSLLLITALALLGLISSCKSGSTESEKRVDADSVLLARNPMALDFDTAELSMIRPGLEDLIRSYEQIRKISIDNSVLPAVQFNPVPEGFVVPADKGHVSWPIPGDVDMPENRNELAFMSIPELASLLRQKKISSVELTTFFLDRLKKYDPELHCVITLTEQYALEQAARADSELAAGTDRGILHGIPYGVKDLFAFPGYKTTWGAGAYADQVIDTKATVIARLEEAGAVLLAKLTLGELAMGDIWFADTTRNPWNLDEGSSGSSAGSASATAAGLVPFAIGTETWGSIVSPSTRCGVTGLRPTYGRISRYGAMALSWSMDKAGPICRSASDCAIVFDAIRGSDGKDPMVTDAAFDYNPGLDLSTLRVGYLKEAFNEDYNNKKQDEETLKTLRKMGIRPVPVSLSTDIPVNALSIILEAEAAAAFDELTRSNRDSLLVQQNNYSWPNIFRTARYISAVEYIQANRLRSLLIEDVNRIMSEVDVLVTPSFGGNQLLMTNLTGQPVVVVPNGFDRKGSPTSISFLGNLYDEATILFFAGKYQEATGFDEQHPPLFK